MGAYNILEIKRKTKQFFAGVIFLGILIGGWFYPLLGYFIPICMMIGLAAGFFRGRIWCDWLCPRGSFYDAFIKPASPKKEIPRLFKNHPFRAAVLSALMLVIIINLIIRWPNPYKIGRFFVILLTITTSLGIILAFISHPRSWCSMCPLGSMINWTSRGRFPLKINSDLCVECKLCSKACPIQIKPYLFKAEGLQTVKDNDCLKCGLCIAVCPKKALQAKQAK